MTIEVSKPSHPTVYHNVLGSVIFHFDHVTFTDTNGVFHTYSFHSIISITQQ